MKDLLAPPVVLTSPRDPVDFLADLKPGIQRPVVLLYREDATADVLCRRSRTLSQTDALRVAQTVNEEAASLGFDPLLLLAVIHVESYYNHLAISPVGAEGLMQLMPPTAEWMADRDGLDWSDHHSFDPILNVRLGSRYLALMMEEFGDLEHALTAYNRGPSATHHILNRYEDLPESVRKGYSTPVIEQYQKLRQIYGHLPAARPSGGGFNPPRRANDRITAARSAPGAQASFNVDASGSSRMAAANAPAAVSAQVSAPRGTTARQTRSGAGTRSRREGV